MAMDNQGSSVAPASPPEAVQGWIESVIVTVSQTSVGQSLMKIIDRFLWVVEKSAEWSLPSQETASKETGKSFGRMELVRPLPWILFLPGLVILRAIRAGLNVGAFILGYPKIQPSGMVRFVQKGRRRLRALNLKAMKNSRRKTHVTKDKRLSMIEAKKALITSIRLTLSTLSCLDSSKSSPSPPPTKIRVGSIDLETTPNPEEKSTTESAGSPMHDTKRKYSEINDSDSDDSPDEILVLTIDRFPSESSSDDPDFNPAECSTEYSSENDVEIKEDIPLEELVDIKKDAMMHFSKEEPKTEFFDLPKEEASGQEAQKTSAQASDNEESRVADLQTVEEADNEFHSPNKFGQDGDATFYSPISSKSGSPERSITPCAEKHHELQTNRHLTNDFINGEVNNSSGATIIGASTHKQVTNGIVTEKRPTIAGKFHHKGKRTNHGNRKKK